MEENHEWKWVDGRANSFPIAPSTSYDNNQCAVVHKRQTLVDEDCFSKHPATSQLDILFLVKQNKTWEEALDSLQGSPSVLSFLQPAMLDLLSFHTEEESAYAQSIVREAQTEEVWIGLCFLAGRWLWMDGKTDDGVSSPVCPANGRNCGTLSGKGKQARSCVERRNFFCFQRPASER